MVKRGILFFIATFVTIVQSFAFEVTFQVDMSNQTVSPAGVHIAGSFADANNDGTIDNLYPNWDPSVLALTNAGNGIWSITLDLAAGSYEYKFINGNVWDITEFFPADAPCVQGTFGNRAITVANANEILPVVCWNECVACGQGYTDPTACNYVPSATVEGPCTYPDFIPTIIIDQPSLGCFSNGVRIYPSGGTFAQIGWGTSFGGITSVSDTLIIYGNVTQDFYFIGTEPGSMNLIATVASNVFSYTDLNPPTGEMNYMIEVVGVSCDPSRNLVYSRSNILDLLAQNVSEELNSTIQIFPNPASTNITIQINERDLGAPVFIFNALGQEVFSERISSVNQMLNIEKLSEGFYFLKLEGRVIRLQIVK